jgi:hypothetical protein
MATSYLSTAQKDYLNGIFDNVHETFAREITVYMDPVITVITASPTFNALYNADLPSAVNTPEYTPVSYKFKARIHYMSQEQSLFPGAEAQQRIVYPVGTIKIKVNAEAFGYLKEAKRVEFEGRRYSMVSDYKPFGIFGPKYYSFILSPIDE